MWKLKSNYQVNHDRKLRKSRYEYIFVFIITVLIYLVYKFFGSINTLYWLLINNLELLISFLFLPLSLYFLYRNFVTNGTLHARPGKICLGCEKGMGYSDDGWGYRSYGLRRKNWYQIKACDTPEKCDIHYLHEVEWINENDNLETDTKILVDNDKRYKFSIDHDDVIAILVMLLFAASIVAGPFLIGWALYYLL